MHVLSKNSHYIWSDIQKRHWVSHAKKTVLDPVTAMAYMQEIDATLDDAISLAFADADEQFDQSTGEKIAEGMLLAKTKP